MPFPAFEIVVVVVIIVIIDKYYDEYVGGWLP
jgi:hypothetical protein